jgi:mevalonate pyrophosphate decarboxylase
MDVNVSFSQAHPGRAMEKSAGMRDGKINTQYTQEEYWNES